MSDRRVSEEKAALDEAAVEFFVDLRKLRLASGEPSIREIARATNFSPSTIHSIFKGVQIPSWQIVEQVVAYLDGDVMQFKQLYDKFQIARYHLLARRSLGSSGQAASDDSVVAVEGAADQAFIEALIQETVPDRIRLVFQEARRCLQTGVYTGVLVLTRWILEAVCSDFDVASKSLTEALQVLKSREVIDHRLFEWSVEVAKLGNQAVHSTGDMITHDDADDALTLVFAVLIHVYLVRPAYERHRLRIQGTK
jgi:hypothetical protein